MTGTVPVNNSLSTGKEVEFEKIFGENLRNQVDIAKEFIKRMKVKSQFG